MGRYSNGLVDKINKIKLNDVRYWELFLVHACNAALASNELELDNNELLKFYNLVDNLWCKDERGRGISELADALASMWPLESSLSLRQILCRM